MKREAFLSLPFHVLFLALFPALALLVNNLGETTLWVVRRPLIASVLLAMLLFLGAWLLVRDWLRASLWTAWALVLFFSYGHVYQLIEDFELFGFLLGRHRYLLLVWGAMFILGTWTILRKNKSSVQLTRPLNLVTFLLVLFQVVQIGMYQVNKGISQRRAQASISDPFLKPSNPANMPDVYLILLDMYGREDALNAYYHYDNHQFIAQLEELGFYVADCARSNYSHTLLSLTSQLNLEFVDDLLSDLNLESLSYLLKHNLVLNSFREIGYTTIAFDIGSTWANLDQTDIFYDRPPASQGIDVLDPFEVMFIEGNLGRLYLDYYISQNFKRYVQPWTRAELKAQQIEMILDHLRLIPSMEGPKFVFAHIMAFHPPFVFNADGSVNLQAEELSNQVGLPIQMDYFNPQIIEIVKHIVKDTYPEPIVILEGDHGFGELQRTSILNALYLPDGGEKQLYPHISLINTFRVVFNQYFGTSLPLLEDLSYMRLEDDWYDYVPHEEWNPACIP